MRPRWLWTAVGLGLALVIAFAIRFPHQMVSPGDLIPAHAALQQNCFACHAPFRGPSAERCMSCHAVAEIGRRTTAGAPIIRPGHMPAFHQALADRNCMACHSDHPRPMLTHGELVRFDHELLRADLRGNCGSCHARPRDELHRNATQPCSQCHTAAAWTPASFDHDRFFSLTGPHDVECKTCHVGGNFAAFTCYSCHEHERSRMEAEHREHGIVNIDNCAACHRSAHGEHGEGGESRQGGEED